MFVAKITAAHVVDPGIMGAVGQIVQVALVTMGLALKRDVAVSIATHAEADEPLKEIGNVKEHEQHLALLRRVDALVIQQLMAQINARMHKHHPQQVDG